MADTILKRWNGTSWEEVNPQTTHTQIVASGTPSSTTYLRGDGSWQTISAGSTFTGGTITTNLTISNTLPFVNFTDTDHNNDFQIGNNNGKFEINDTSTQENRFRIYSSGDVEISGASIDIEGTTLLNDSGTLKWDGTAVSLVGHTHTFASLTSKPTTLAGFGITDADTSAQVNAKIAALVDSSPATLDTLNELAAALGDDPNFATTMATALGGKMSTTHPANSITSTHLYMANGDGFVWNDTTNVMYVRKDGTDLEVIDSGNIGSQSVNFATSSGSTTGNAATATKLATARNIALSGDVTGSANFDGSANISITATIADDSHNHIISNVDGLQTALDGKAASSHTHSTVTDYAPHLYTRDNRIIAPSEDSTYRMKFGFTSWANNNSSPYADYLHLRSYSDGSGGKDNLVMFKKDGIGMRIWQQDYGSATAYSSYVDVIDSSTIGSQSVSYATSAGRAYPKRVGNIDLNFNWSGQSGQPPWLWGGSDGSNMYVYNPSNFSVNYATSAGNADTTDGYHIVYGSTGTSTSTLYFVP
jgi:hypothetical protein